MKHLYVQFSRTIAPETSKGPALISFMQHNNWTKLVILTSTESLWFESGLGLTTQLKAEGMEVLKPAAFQVGGDKDAPLSEIRRSGIRIIFMLSDDADAKDVALRAQFEGMSSGWGWMLANGIIEGTPPIQGWLYLRPFLSSERMQAFSKLVSNYTKSRFDLPSTGLIDLTYSAALYDGIMLYAYAATKLLSEGGDLRNGTSLTHAVRRTEIIGVGGGTVALNEQGDPISSYSVMNYVVGVGSVMGSVAVGLYNKTVQQYMAYEQEVLWPGNKVQVPTDCLSGESTQHYL